MYVCVFDFLLYYFALFFSVFIYRLVSLCKIIRVAINYNNYFIDN